MFLGYFTSIMLINIMANCAAKAFVCLGEGGNKNVLCIQGGTWTIVLPSQNISPPPPPRPLAVIVDNSTCSLMSPTVVMLVYTETIASHTTECHT